MKKSNPSLPIDALDFLVKTLQEADFECQKLLLQDPNEESGSEDTYYLEVQLDEDDDGHPFHLYLMWIDDLFSVVNGESVLNGDELDEDDIEGRLYVLAFSIGFPQLPAPVDEGEYLKAIMMMNGVMPLGRFHYNPEEQVTVLRYEYPNVKKEIDSQLLLNIVDLLQIHVMEFFDPLLQIAQGEKTVADFANTETEMSKNEWAQLADELFGVEAGEEESQKPKRKTPKKAPQKKSKPQSREK